VRSDCRAGTVQFRDAAGGRRAVVPADAHLGLDPAYAEALDELIDDSFLGLVEELAGSAESDVRSWRLGINLARGHRDDYFARLLATIELHNRLASEAAEVRSRRGVPRTGSLGMELPRDHDLKAWVALDNEWWRTSPMPGSLRGDGRRPGEDHAG
jgi:hypothetical protein